MESWVIYLIGAVLGILGLVVASYKEKTVAGRNKWILAAPLLLVAAFLILAQTGVLSDYGISPFATTTVVVKEKIQPGVTTETYQPTASYSVKDKFSTTTVSGTAYYKEEGLPATTSALTNVRSGKRYTYWVDNDTYYVKPKVFTATPGANVVIAEAWQNGTATITGYDLVNRKSITNGEYNTSLGANDQANIEITYQGTAKKSAGPFGGVMVVEYNATISSVTATGPQILSNNPYHVTYTPSATTHTYKMWAYSSDLDDGSGAVRRINLQFKNGATPVGKGASWKVTFIPANYYVTNAGDIVLDTEKYANDDTTRTGLQAPSATFYWGA